MTTGRVGSTQRPLALHQVSIDDGFWTPRIDAVRRHTLPLQHSRLRDTGRLDALRLTWKPGDEPVPHIFWDSDVAKWIEAASNSLATAPDPGLAQLVDEAVELLTRAQQADGYLNTYFTVVAPGRRWTDLRDAHELYCAGHLIEAAVAHVEATGEHGLLDVVMRYADHISEVFGPGAGQQRGYPGHPEIELALMRLFRATGQERYRRLCSFFIDERGRQPYYFEQEAGRRGTPGYFGSRPPFDRREQEPERFREYNQSHAPVREQQEAVGHAVRAMYLYSGMSDVAAETGDSSLAAACSRLWQHVTTRRMYVTGGLGSTASIEGFTADFDLPNETAYAETCAAIGLVFWAHRMARLERDSRYTDVLELALYNGVLAGISMDGMRFSYENPLASLGDHHRQSWFGVACCPPNVARLLTSLGRYAYAQDENEAVIHLFVAGAGTFELAGSAVTVMQRTDYPWDGTVTMTVRTERPTDFALSVRVPGWCRDPALTVAGERVDLAAVLDRGYARIHRRWRTGDVVELALPMPVRRRYADPRVAADVGRVALGRGPLVYCVEACDNAGDVGTLALPREADITVAEDASLPGVVVLRALGQRLVPDGRDALYLDRPPVQEDVVLTAVPYFAWDNRAPGAMQVWVRETSRATDPAALIRT